MGWLHKILRTGRVVEPAEAAPTPVGTSIAGVRGSVQIRHVDAGSCNGCEVEISGCLRTGSYDAERFVARLVASHPARHALLVTGVVTRNMAEPLRTPWRRTSATGGGHRLR